MAWLVLAAVQVVLWGLGVAFLVTGLVLWHDWHALAARGIDATGRVEHCEWKASGGIKSPRSGYFWCSYTYRPAKGGPPHDGDFQSFRRWEKGEPVPIRFLEERPATSATAKDLEHPSIAPGAMIALGAGWLGWLAWQARKRRAKAT